MANANIFQQFLKEPPSAMDYADRFAARDTSRQQNALNQLVIGEKVRGIEDQNRLRQLYSQNPNLTADELRRQGFRDEAAKVDSAALEKRKTESDIGLKDAQTGKAQAEAQAKAADIAYEKAQRHAQGIGSVNTPQDIIAYIDAGIQNGVPGFTVENRQKFIDNANSAGSVEEWKKKAIAGSIPVVERFKADADMKRAQLQSDTQIKTTGMNNATQIKTTGMNNAVSIRGQNMTDARQREANSASMSKPFEVTGEDGRPTLVQQDKQGNIRPVQGYKPKGAASDQQAFKDAKETLNLVVDAKKALKDATSSTIGAGVDYVAGAFGKSTKGSEASAKLDVIGGYLTSKVPKMSGPQSDKDVLMYQQMAGRVADRTQPVAVRLAALEQIEALSNRQISNFEGNKPTDPKPSGATGEWSVVEVK